MSTAGITPSSSSGEPRNASSHRSRVRDIRLRMLSAHSRAIPRGDGDGWTISRKQASIDGVDGTTVEPLPQTEDEVHDGPLLEPNTAIAARAPPLGQDCECSDQEPPHRSLASEKPL